jgi:oxygen-dependent protoporphyrinogen oxidase
MVSALQGGVYSSSSDDLGIRATIPQLANTFDAMKEQGVKVTLSGAVERICSMRESNNKQMEEKVPGYKPQVFASFDGGYAEAYEALAEKSGATIHIDAFISGVTKNKDGFQLKGAGEGTFDKVLFATPAPTTAMLMKQILPEAVEPLKKIQLASSAVVAMKFESAEGLPDNSGVLVASDEQGVKAKAFTFSSKKWPHLGERGGALVRASFGRFGDDALVRAEEDDLVDWALDDLKTITGFDGREAELKEIYVQRWFGGLPVYGPEHLNTVDEIREILRTADGIEATGAWRDGVGVPNVIAEARAAAKRLIG